MNQATAKKVAVLTKTTDKYISRVDPKGNPFASSAAKYYPALKKLAAK